MRCARGLVAIVILVLGGAAIAETTLFFEPCQSYTLVSPGVTSDSIESNGYLFT